MGLRSDYFSELRSYVIGLVLALALTGAAFVLVVWKLASATRLLDLVFVLGLTQIIVHFRFFLHIDLSRSNRDDLDLLLFSTLIVMLMVGGTLVIMFNLHQRMF